MNTRTHTAYDAALEIVKRLRSAGHAALFAGGCVRDRLLGREPKDYDVATDAPPERVAQIFTGSRLVGAKFGVVLVRKYRRDIEVATFRTDGEYTDGRRPDSVTFGTAEEDARRRDFTINGLFHDPIENRVLDFVDGQTDLRAGVIRTIGRPERRFGEDHLRMLRAVRFAAKLGFTIEAESFAAIRNHANQLRSIAPERIWMELSQVFASPSRAMAWHLLIESGLRSHLNPDWPANPEIDEMAGARFAGLPDVECSATLGLATALSDFSTDAVLQICRSMRLSNAECEVVLWLVRSLPMVKRADSLQLADIKNLIHGPAWMDLLALAQADLAARYEPREALQALGNRAAAIPEDAVAPAPLLTGDDLLAAGFAPGPSLGTMMRALYRAQLNDEVRDVEQAWRFVRNWKN